MSKLGKGLYGKGLSLRDKREGQHLQKIRMGSNSNNAVFGGMYNDNHNHNIENQKKIKIYKTTNAKIKNPVKAWAEIAEQFGNTLAIMIFWSLISIKYDSKEIDSYISKYKPECDNKSVFKDHIRNISNCNSNKISKSQLVLMSVVAKDLIKNNPQTEQLNSKQVHQIDALLTIELSDKQKRKMSFLYKFTTNSVVWVKYDHTNPYTRRTEESLWPAKIINVGINNIQYVWIGIKNASLCNVKPNKVIKWRQSLANTMYVNDNPECNEELKNAVDIAQKMDEMYKKGNTDYANYANYANDTPYQGNEGYTGDEDDNRTLNDSNDGTSDITDEGIVLTKINGKRKRNENDEMEDKKHEKEQIKKRKLNINVESNDTISFEKKNNGMENGKIAFRTWLQDEVGLGTFYNKFEDNQYADVRMIKHMKKESFNIILENEIGMNAIHKELLFDHIEKFKQQQKSYEDFFDKDRELRKYKSLFDRNGIVRFEDLRCNIKTKDDLKAIFKMDCKETHIDTIWKEIAM
eukprot:289819_1